MTSLAPPPPSLVPGSRLDRYELICPVADGGMASVWVARLRGKHGFEKLVAIKTILPKYAADDRFQQMFLDEARIASGIEHVNVAQILDLGDENGTLYIVMEWIDGDSLSKLTRVVEKKKATVPPGVLCRILADVCGGLHAAHELKGTDGASLGVVHRDVSPQNILVSTRGVAKLIDFGIAKARDRISGETSAGLLKGKVQYMAPEQAVGQKIDARADVWAVGAILYHLFSGTPAYEGENQLATLHLLTSGNPPAPLSPTKCPPPIAAVVARAMQFDPRARFESAAEMQRAIEAAMLEANIPTSQADVAAFTALHMADRATARKKALDLALKAAAERERVGQSIRSAALAASRDSICDADPPATPTPSSIQELSASGSRSSSGNAVVIQAEPPITAAVSPETSSLSASSSTAGNAEIPALPAETPDKARQARRRMLASIVGGAVALAALIVVGAGATMARSGGTHEDGPSPTRLQAVSQARAEPIPSPPPDDLEVTPVPPPTTAASSPKVPSADAVPSAAKPRASSPPRPAGPTRAGKPVATRPAIDDGF